MVRLVAVTVWYNCIILARALAPPLRQSILEDLKDASAGRRGFLVTVAATVASPLLPAHAKGLVQFPLTKPLFNTYTFMRVGTTLLEEEDILSTNPLFLTNRDDALSADGAAQVQKASRELWGLDGSRSSPTLVIHSLAASAIDTANILQQTLQLGRDRIRPEFTLLDPRGIGMFDSLTRSTTMPAVWALDADQGGKPPPNEDGTPNESLEDQAVRLRQLLSYLETQYSGESIVLVFPDGTGPALLACLMAGIPLNQVHRLEFGPAEIRRNVTPALIKAWYKDSAENDENYQKILAQGRITLAELRNRKELVNRKDEKLEAERLSYEKMQREKAAEKAAAEQAAEQTRQARAAAMTSSAERSTTPTSETSDSFWLSMVGSIAVASIGLAQLYRNEPVAPMEVSTETNNQATLRRAHAGSTVEPVSNTTVNSEPPSLLNDELSEIRVNGQQESRRSLYTEAVNGVNGDAKAKMPATTEQKTELAEQAMKDYLDQDDGGEAWLSSIADILEEEKSLNGTDVE